MRFVRDWRPCRMVTEMATDLTVEIGRLLQLICEVPAPTFSEAQRAALIAELWTGAGLQVQVDDIQNVFATTGVGSGPRVLLAAHSDTVFPAGTDVSVQKTGGRWLAPGIGDNSASVAVLTHLANTLSSLDGPLPRISLASPVGEEGRGDLRGMRRLLADHEGEFDYVIAVDGHLGSIVNRAVGSRRFEFRFSAVGGHSWGDYPAPSAVHAMADAMSALTGLDVPETPRSSFNIGTVRGGTSSNASAESAMFDLDLRSLDPDVLARLEKSALELVREAADRHRVRLETVQIGDRPVATVDNDALVRCASEALQEQGIEPRTSAGSTDANAALAAGLPSICMGVYRGGDAHRLSEWLGPESLGQGYQALVGFLRRLSARPG